MHDSVFGPILAALLGEYFTLPTSPPQMFWCSCDTSHQVNTSNTCSGASCQKSDLRLNHRWEENQFEVASCDSVTADRRHSLMSRNKLLQKEAVRGSGADDGLWGDKHWTRRLMRRQGGYEAFKETETCERTEITRSSGGRVRNCRDMNRLCHCASTY